MTIIGRHFLVSEVTPFKMIGFCCMHDNKIEETFQCEQQWHSKSSRFINIIRQSRRVAKSKK